MNPFRQIAFRVVGRLPYVPNSGGETQIIKGRAPENRRVVQHNVFGPSEERELTSLKRLNYCCGCLFPKRHQISEVREPVYDGQYERVSVVRPREGSNQVYVQGLHWMGRTLPRV